MKIRIITFQPEPKYVYHIGYKFQMFLEDALNQHFSDLNPDLNLDLSIVCLSDNAEGVKLGGKMKHRGKGNNITQQIILPNKHLYFEAGQLFHSKKFDFIFSKKAYQTYPLDLFAKYTRQGLQQYLPINGFEVPKEKDIKAFENHLSNELAENTKHFKYQNEELLHLQELIDRTHWAYESRKGKKWLESEIGQKWVRLSEKYSFDIDGNLTPKRDEKNLALLSDA